MRGSGWIESAVAVTISLAGLGTSWAGYQAGLWNGRQAQHYGAAGAYRTKASAAALDASVARAVDAGLFSAWFNAKVSGDETMAYAYQRRFPPALAKAFPAWLAAQPMDNLAAAPPSPFSLPVYRQPGLVQARALNEAADREFMIGQSANRISDGFTRASVILAMAMFFGGVGQVFHERRVRIVLIVMAMGACAIGAYQVLTLPVTAIG